MVCKHSPRSISTGVSQWPGPPPKDMMGVGKPSGWEESSPPQQRRNIPNYDDGTSLWGGQPQQARGGGGGGGGGMGAGGPGGRSCARDVFEMLALENLGN